MDNNVLENIIESNETKIWEGKPDLRSIITFKLPALFFIIPVLYFGITAILSSIEASSKLFFVMGLITLIIGIGCIFLVVFMIPYLNYKVTNYIITDKRIIFKSGIIGADIKSIYYEQIKSIFVNVGFVGKIFGTGDVITTGNAGKLFAIDKPYEVYNLIQKQQSITKNSMHSGRADYKFNTNDYKEFIQETEKMKREIYQ